MVFVNCSPGRIRTYNPLLTLIPKFPMGVDYIIIPKDVSVSSLYGAPVARVPTVFAYPSGRSLHRYPEIFQTVSRRRAAF